jgi:ribulose-phosphate 3-epimerase
MEIIPSILTNDLREVEEKITRAEGVVKRIQIDVIDGQFAPNKTFDPSLLEDFETDLNIDFHLITKEPKLWVEKAVRAQAERIIGQIEHMTDQVEFVGKVQELGLLVGLAVDLDTPVSGLDPAILADLDVVLLMSVPAGFGGQEFDPRVHGKIKELVKIREKDKSPFRICIDGGVTEEIMADLVEEGVDEVIVGRRLFEGDLAENIEKWKKKIS